MKRDVKFYIKLFVSMFNISAFTFGGGFVIISLMKKKFVDEYKWLDDNEILDFISIAQSSPGAIAVNGAVAIGYRLAGVAGMFTAVLATVLPPLIILSLISLSYTAFKDNSLVRLILLGIQASVVAVVLDVAFYMASDIFKEKKKIPIIIMAGAFVLTWFFKINIILIIALCALVGLITVCYNEKKNGGKIK